MPCTLSFAFLFYPFIPRFDPLDLSFAMAEAVAAFSLAVNILQVVEYGYQFVRTAWQIWDAGGGSVDTLRSLRLVADDLKPAMSQLSGQPQSSQPTYNNNLSTLGMECAKVAQEMLATLDEVEGDLTSRKKRIAIMAAFKQIWKRNEIEALQSRLESLRNQINFSLLVSLR